MKRGLLTLALFVVSAVAAQAVTLSGWDVSPVSEDAASPLSAGTIAAGISNVAPSGQLSRGPGAGSPGNPASSVFGASGFDAGDLSLALSASDYFTFSIAPTSGNQMTLQNVIYKLSATTSGATGGALFSDVGGFASTADAISTFGITGGTNNDNSISLGASFQNLTGPVEFRLYFFGGGGSTTDKVRFRNLSGDDLIVDGTVGPIPEPSTLLCALFGAGLFAIRRRRWN